MIEITAEVRALIDKAAAGVELAGDEYIDPSDGLIHCKKCGGQRQTVVPCFGKSGYFMPRCICQCQREAEEQRKAAEERQRRMERIKRRKAQGLQDRYLYDYTFANDNGKNPLMDKARAYVENWKEAYTYKKYSIDDFAKRFGVSRRTINYDIVYLMDFYEIDTKPGPHGGISLILHVSLQPVFIPLSQCHGHWIAPALCADFVGLLL